MLEKIVRPFESPAVTGGARIVIATAKNPPEPAVIQWGAAGKLPEPVKAIFANITIKDETKFVEVSRETDTVRVKNHDDPTQFVDVARIKKIAFSPTKKGSPSSLVNVGAATPPSGTPTPGGQNPIDGVTADASGTAQAPTATAPPNDESFELKPPAGDPPT